MGKYIKDKEWGQNLMPIKFPLKFSTNNSNYEEVDLEKLKSLFKEAGNIVKTKRQELGLTRKALSEKTLISAAVLEAIEEGWPNKLPEKAYLSSMLILLENELKLSRGILKGALYIEKQKYSKPILRSFTPGTIEVFSTWQGSLLYILLMMFTLFSINTHQRKIALKNSSTFLPINSEFKSLIEDNSIKTRTNNKNKKLLSPIINNLSQWKGLISNFSFLKDHGDLIIEIKDPKQITIKRFNKIKFKMDNVKGEINLNVSLPIEIKSKPPLSNGEKIRYKGKELLFEEKNNGLYYINSKFKVKNEN